MKNFKLKIGKIKSILIIGILIILSCVDNIRRWELQVDTLPHETGLVVMHISDTYIDTLDNSQHFDDGTELYIEAYPILGWTFDHWRGDIEHSDNPTILLKDDHKSITAVFKSHVFGSDSTFTLIALGQSNMVGVGTDGGDLLIDTRVKAWNNLANEWVLADPSNSIITETLFSNYHTNHNNLAFHFAKQIAEVYDVEVRIIILAKSGINIGQYITVGNESTYYDTLRNNLTASEINEVDCILWHQGESNNFGNANHYADSLQSIIDRLRAEPEIDLTTPFIAGELIEGTSRDTRNDVYFNLEWFIEDEYVAVAKLHDLPGIEDDRVHFNGSSLVIAGRERYFEAFQSMVTN